MVRALEFAFSTQGNRYWIRLPSARASRKITEVHDLFLLMVFLKVTLDCLTSVHTAPHGFSLVSQRTLDERSTAGKASAKEDRENWIC